MTVTINGSGTITGASTLATTPAVTQINSSSSNTPTVFGDSAGTQVGTLCRAWVKFDGYTGTRNGSFNVSSVTRNAAGDYTLNFATAMSDANYATVATANQNASGNAGGLSIGYPDNSSTITYSTTQVRVAIHFGNAATYADMPNVSVAVFR